MKSRDHVSELHSATEAKNLQGVEQLLRQGAAPDTWSLFLAIRKKAHAVLKALIKGGVDVNAPEPYWRSTPIVEAIECQDSKSVEILLGAGASPNKHCRSGPPLICAATHGQTEAANLLIAAGADLEQRSSPAEMTPLIVAALVGHVEVVKLLLEAGANPLSVDVLDRTAYDIAVEEKEEEIAKVLAPVSSGKIPRSRTPLEVLLDSIKNRDAFAFDECLATGVDINARDRFGWRPLYRAIDVGSVEFVKRLIKAGAIVNMQVGGTSPLEMAVSKERIEIAEMLVKAGATPKALNRNCADPFLTACMMGYVGLAKLFLKSGADPNSATMARETALMRAVGKLGSIQLVRLLVSSGAEVERADDNGWTALFHAVQSNPPVTFVHRKFPSGAKLMSAEPLEHAPEDDRLTEIVRCLLNHGADVNRRDESGRTPLTFASTRGVAQLLIQAGARLEIRDKADHDVSYWLKKNNIALRDISTRESLAAAKPSLKAPLGRRSAKGRRL